MITPSRKKGLGLLSPLAVKYRQEYHWIKTFEFWGTIITVHNMSSFLYLNAFNTKYTQIIEQTTKDTWPACPLLLSYGWLLPPVPSRKEPYTIASTSLKESSERIPVLKSYMRLQLLLLAFSSLSPKSMDCFLPLHHMYQVTSFCLVVVFCFFVLIVCFLKHFIWNELELLIGHFNTSSFY